MLSFLYYDNKDTFLKYTITDAFVFADEIRTHSMNEEDVSQLFSQMYL